MTETFTSATNGPDEDAPFRARLSFDLDVDICVVGAGLAGLTVALEAARQGASVAVLEGRHVGWNASGHQLGTVMPGYSLPIADLIERVGLDDARELWALSKELAEYVRAAATEEAMPGIALTEGALEVSNVDVGETLISRLQMLSADFETEVEGWQVDRVRDKYHMQAPVRHEPEIDASATITRLSGALPKIPVVRQEEDTRRENREAPRREPERRGSARRAAA